MQSFINTAFFLEIVIKSNLLPLLGYLIPEKPGNNRAKLASSDCLKLFRFSKVVCISVKADYGNVWSTHAKRIQYLDMRTRDLNV